MPGYWSLLRPTALAVGALVFGSTVVQGATLYVDGQISSASCTTYAPASRSCSGGSDRGYRTLAGASSAAVAGDTVYLRGGTYGEALTPARSGTASQPITFAAYPGETPTLSGLSGVALSFTQRSYIVVDGLTATNVGGWGRLEDSSYNTIRNCTFTRATVEGTTGGLKLVRATYNKILDNTIDDGNDNIVIQESDRNVVQGNTVSQGRHSLLSLRCGNYNVVRGNSFSNPDQKDLEIYDCEGTSDAPVKLDATKRNLVDGNVIADTRSSSSNYDYNGIQFGGQQGIVRRNVFRDDLGGGINFQYYSDESLYNNRNRVYHNTFYNNRCYGIIGASGDGSRFYDNRARNNILYKNTTCSGGATQIAISNTSQVILADNALSTTSPGFADETARDLQLAPGSPMIDAAAFLTTATAAGSGTQITVADASYFFDGYGIPGELGDEIQLQGQTTVARVVAVDLAANRLTLDRSLSWTAGLGVALRFGGAKPDLGAFESDSESLPFLSVGDVSVTEGDSGTATATFTVTLSAASTQTVTVSYSTANGTATAGSDYTAASGSLSFSPGATSRTVAVSVTGDTAAEGDEDFLLNLSSPTSATLGDGQGRATIQNDDTVASTLSIADASTTEGNSGTQGLVFTATLSPASTQTVTVSYATANGTATAGSDYVAATGSLSFTAGQTSKTVSVTINGDTTVESNETFTLTLSSPSGATLADGQAQGTITNDDSAPLPTLSIGNVSVTEGNSGTALASFTVTLSATSSSTVTVAFATANGTATAGSDYVAQSGNLSFTAGQTTKTISVTVNGDTTVESNETFVVNLSSPTGATIADAQGQATITNDDSAPLPTLSINDASVAEGNSGTTAANFTVTLSAASSSTVTVAFATANGTATAGSDFVAQTGNLTFTAGQTTKTITVTVNGDTTVESNETFVVNLSSPSGATIADAQGQATVTNDDSTPPPTDDPVVWTSAVGVAVNANSLTKTAGNGWGNAGSVSTQQLASGDGYVEFTASETTTYRLLGLSNGNTNTAYEDIDFAIDAYAGGQIKVYENGALKGTFGSFATGDKLRVGVVSGIVRYSRNGTVFYTSVKVPTYPLLVDTSLYNTGSTLSAVVVSGFGTTTPPPPSVGDSVVWTSAVGVAVNANSLTKTAANAWGNAGAVSTQQLASGDGYVEFTASETTTYRLLGLSNGNTNTAYEDIDFAIDAYAGGQIKVYENGALKGTFGTYATGDKLRIGVVGGVVRYYKNGIVLYTSTKVPTYPLLVDTSLYNTGSTLNAVVASGFGTTTPPPPSVGDPVVWTSAVGVTVNANSLTKTAANAWGNAGAVSTQQLASGDGYVEFTASETTTYRLLGLSNGNTNTAYEDIDFAIDAYAGGQIRVYENGAYRGAFGTYATGDKLRIGVVSGVVRYYKNGTVLYTSTKVPAYPLLVDTSLYNTGSTLSTAVVSGF